MGKPLAGLENGPCKPFERSGARINTENAALVWSYVKMTSLTNPGSVSSYVLKRPEITCDI